MPAECPHCFRTIDPVRIEEIAERTGRTKATVSERMNKPDAPAPWLETGRLRLWLIDAVADYLGPKKGTRQ